MKTWLKIVETEKKFFFSFFLQNNREAPPQSNILNYYTVLSSKLVVLRMLPVSMYLLKVNNKN